VSPAGDMARSLGVVDEWCRNRSTDTHWSPKVVHFVTETDSHAPETSDFGGLLDVYSRFGLRFRISFPDWGALPVTTGHFYCGELPDISNAV
jgi:hypothetical protein